MSSDGLNDKFEKAYRAAIKDLHDLDQNEVGLVLFHMFEQFTSGGFTVDQALRIIAYGLFPRPDIDSTNGDAQ